MLLVSLGRALADDQGIGTLEEWEANQAVKAYDQVTIRFNTHIRAFSSWAAFKTGILSTMSPDGAGNCYALTEDRAEPVAVTIEPLPKPVDNGWQKTSGKGWRRKKSKRAFVEYRVNTQANMLLRVEGTKSGFFFTRIQKICEFPLPP